MEGDYDTTTGKKNKYNTQTGKLVGGSSSSSGGGSSGGSGGGGSSIVNIDSNPGQALAPGQKYTYQGVTYTQPGGTSSGGGSSGGSSGGGGSSGSGSRGGSSGGGQSGFNTFLINNPTLTEAQKASAATSFGVSYTTGSTPVSTVPSQANFTPTPKVEIPQTFTEQMSLAQEAGIQNYTGTAQQKAQIQAYQTQQAQTQTGTGGQTGQQDSSIVSQPTSMFSGLTLQQGSQGNDVKALQSALGIVSDGQFGPKTLAAVKAYQLSHGLTVDGIVGPKTQASMNTQNTVPGTPVVQGLQNQQIGEPTETPLVNTGNPEFDATMNNLLVQLKGTSPQTTTSQILKQVYKDMGYNEIQDEYHQYNEDYADLQDEKNDKVQDINNNPWYTEGERVKRLGQLDEKYEGREIILQNKIKLSESQIDNMRSDAQFISGQVMAQVNAQAQLDQSIILKAIDLAETQLSAESKLSGPASVQEYQYAVSQGYSGSFSQYQNEDANRKISIAKAGVGGLTPSQINTTVNSIAGAFDNEAVVKDYNTIKRQVEVFNSLGNSATDDIQRVYAFAKIADPTSAVKEGEYNSIEKYSQALLQRSGLQVKRVFSATGILTPEARTALSATIGKSLEVAQKNYNQVASEYQRQINDAYAGTPRTITNYSTTPTTNNSVNNVESSLTFSGKNAYIPRSVWSTLGGDMDELLADMEAEGYTLLITD